MSFDAGDQKQWICGKSGTVNLQKVSCMVRDIGEPCLHQSPIKVVVTINKMLKPDKWQTTFDSDGKVFGFQKALKLIMLGGVDPSIRPEVWEFLLGCYTLSSTADYRRRLRTARRERYEELIKECQSMHSSIGSGSLAYVVGSKVMDMRTMAKEEVKHEHDSNVVSERLQDSFSDNCQETCSTRESTDCAAAAAVYDDSDSCFIPSSTRKSRSEEDEGSQFRTSNYYEFPPLPVTNLFETNEAIITDNNKNERKSNVSTRRKLRFEDDDDHVYDFQISNNVDLVMESNSNSKFTTSNNNNSKIKVIHQDSHCKSTNMDYEIEIVNEDPNGRTQSQERVSEWLWTLHQIVVDVVRTDSHLEFYEDSKNLARMSDILAVYAWVDPATGYCQGMSDLLSPFIVLFEDNADAFWCFEMLLRRMRENFTMEGTTGVMKQLEALWNILEHVDKEMFTHLSQIGAESLHFAFRMLLVLFRRELSFTEALCMWEMMWAADFDESLAFNLENSCPELLVLKIPTTPTRNEIIDNENSEAKCGNLESSMSENNNANGNGIKSSLNHPFCGLTKNLWSKNERFQICTIISSTRNGDDELPIFCVAAILVLNRHKVIRETRSIDDLIKIFNDNMLKIRVKRCIRTAIKLRKKYFYKLIKNRSPAAAYDE